MDPLSTAASITTVIDLTAKVVHYISTAIGATKDRTRLRSELQACDDILQQIRDQSDDTEESKAWSKIITALEEPGAPLARLSVALTVVKDKLQHKTGLRRAVSSLKWPFEEKEIEKIIGAIRNERGLLELALSNEHRKLTQEIQRSAKVNERQLRELIEAIEKSSKDHQSHFADLKNGVDRLHTWQATHEADEQRQKILDWLTSLDHATQQSDLRKKRQPGTGQWLLSSEEYQTWLASGNQTIYCPGIPGAGKTTIMSIIVDDLFDRFSGDVSVGIAFVYCNFKRKDEQTLEGLLSSLLKQLIQRRPFLPESLQDLYHKLEQLGRPSSTDISMILHLVASSYSKVYLLVDALDECQVSSNCRSKFISEILSLQRNSPTNLLATSRYIPEIGDRFKKSPVKEIRASDEDVAHYLEDHLDQLPRCVARDPDLQNEITTSIIKAVDGMFLLAQLHLHSLVGKRSSKAVRTALGKLSSGSNTYDSAYDDAMERIRGQVKDQEDLAMQVLSWITCAMRPLTTVELQHALAVEVGDLELDGDNIPDIDDMVSVCAGLVTVDEESTIIRLVHYTTQEYFEKTQLRWFPGGHLTITNVCTTYLSFLKFENGYCPTIEEFKQRLRLNPFYEYSARNWGAHARATSTHDTVISFLRKPGQVDAAVQGVMADYWHNGVRCHCLTSKMTGLHLAAYYGLEEAVKSLITEDGPDVVDVYGETPLACSARKGRETAAEILCAYGAEVNARDHRGRTPLSRAAELGHEPTVELLLINGAEVNSSDNDNQTPLSQAVGYGHKTVVKLLLRVEKINVNFKDNTGHTALTGAVSSKNEAITKMLLGVERTDINSKDNAGRTSLMQAVSNNHEAITTMLLATNGINPNSMDDQNRTPLWAATRNGNEALVKQLLAAGAEPNLKDNNGYGPLWYAVCARHVPIIQSLLAKGGVDVNSKGLYDRTPLYEAVSTRLHYEIVRLLIDHGADINAANDVGRTALHYAAERSSKKVVRLLIDRGADIHAVDHWADTALHGAAHHGLEAVVKMLIDEGIDVNATASDRWTPLRYTYARMPFYEGIKIRTLLIENGAI